MKELHEKLWLDWLAKDPKRAKSDWPRWKDNGGDIPENSFYCFPCEYDRQHPLEQNRCSCPLDFPGWHKTTWNNEGQCLGGL